MEISDLDKKDVLVVIPARAGSKGVPDKNIKPLNDKPLILYTTEAARAVFPDDQICVSTDGENIIKVVEQTGLTVPFIRPEEISGDSATTYDVLIHAIEAYLQKGRNFRFILLLQPTSPLRTAGHIADLLAYVDITQDMTVSVSETHHNPYYTVFEENQDGHLKICKEGGGTRRQDCPTVYAYNGAMYFINVEALRQASSMAGLKKVKKFVMSEMESIDIDTEFDFFIASQVLRYKNGAQH